MRSDVDGLIVELRPGQLDHPVEPGTQHRIFAAGIGHAFQALQFLLRLLQRFFGHACLIDGLGKFLHVLAQLAVFAQLLADLAHLLAQQRFLVTLIDGIASLLFELTLQAQHFDALAQQRADLVQPRAQIGDFQDLLLLSGLHIHEARDQVDQRRWRLDRLDGIRQFRRRLRQQRDGLAGLALQVQCASFDFGAGRTAIRQIFDARQHERHAVLKIEHAEAPLALDHEVMRAVLTGDVAHDARDGTDLVQIVAPGICVSGSCCNRKPTLRSARTASCAPASERSRFMATGSTVPGNRTILRTGRMISMSSVTVDALFAAGLFTEVSGLSPGARSTSFMLSPHLLSAVKLLITQLLIFLNCAASTLGEPQQQAAVDEGPLL